jgi:hypothetical protein
MSVTLEVILARAVLAVREKRSSLLHNGKYLFTRPISDANFALS